MALIGTPQSLQLLECTFRSTHRETQVIAAIGLAYCRDPRVFQVLTEALHNNLSAIQIEAIEGLGYLGDVRAEPLLEAVERNQHIVIMVCDAATQTLKKMRKARTSGVQEP